MGGIISLWRRMIHSDEHEAGEEGTIVKDNVVIGDPSKVAIGKRNYGGRRTGGRVTGNVVIR
ncbi:hypothetical protein DsansV1_C08g0086921 [Dioscorea sansibarensis]